MGRVKTTIILLLWIFIMSWFNGFDINTVISLFIGSPVIILALYLIWFDSKKPKDQQFRFSNSRWGKK